MAKIIAARMTAATTSGLRRCASPGRFTAAVPSRSRLVQSPKRSEEPGPRAGRAPEGHEIREHDLGTTTPERIAYQEAVGEPTVTVRAQVVGVPRGLSSQLADEAGSPPPIVAGDGAEDRRFLLHPP